jgi:hypothetical protein
MVAREQTTFLVRGQQEDQIAQIAAEPVCFVLGSPA